MKLSDAQAIIATGDIFLFEGVSFFGRWIKLHTRSRFSHVGIALWIQVDGIRRLCCIEALEPWGVRLYPMDYYLGVCRRRGIVCHWFALKQDFGIDRAKVAGYGLAQWGKRYASPWQFLISFGWLTRLVRKHIFGWDVVDTNPERFFCSELVSDSLQHGGYRPDPNEGEDAIAAGTEPGAIALFRCLDRRGTLSLD